jgi:hypothetical protein
MEEDTDGLVIVLGGVWVWSRPRNWFPSSQQAPDLIDRGTRAHRITGFPSLPAGNSFDMNGVM